MSILEISSEALRRIVAHARLSPHFEVCGLLFGDANSITDARRCRNVADDPARRFEIDPAALLAAHRAARGGGPRPIGHYHSHPSGAPVPSPRDAADAFPDGQLWLIVASDEVTAWRAVPRGAVEDRFDPVRLVVSPCVQPPASPQDTG